MKLQGHDFDTPSVELVVIPKGINPKTGEKIPDVVFMCEPIKDFTEFDTLCPIPTAPSVIKPGGKRESNFEDSEYQSAVSRRAELRVAYIVIRSLKATEGLEWETVKISDPKTWKLYREEFKEAGFSDLEITRIENGCFAANALNQNKIDEALANFLRGQQEGRVDITGLNTGQDSTQSGELASGSE